MTIEEIQKELNKLKELETSNKHANKLINHAIGIVCDDDSDKKIKEAEEKADYFRHKFNNFYSEIEFMLKKFK